MRCAKSSAAGNFFPRRRQEFDNHGELRRETWETSEWTDTLDDRRLWRLWP